MKDYDPYDWRTLTGILVERVRSLPEPQRATVLERIEVDPYSFSALRREGGWVEFFVGTDAFGPAISIGKLHLSALASTPAGNN
jgi:hypothetical protein